jgi:hypothetical protein
MVRGSVLECGGRDARGHPGIGDTALPERWTWKDKARGYRRWASAMSIVGGKSRVLCQLGYVFTPNAGEAPEPTPPPVMPPGN